VYGSNFGEDVKEIAGDTFTLVAHFAEVVLG